MKEKVKGDVVNRRKGRLYIGNDWIEFGGEGFEEKVKSNQKIQLGTRGPGYGNKGKSIWNVHLDSNGVDAGVSNGKELERLGLVNRRKYPEDKRKTQYKLTDKGKKAVTEIKKVVNNWDQDKFNSYVELSKGDVVSFKVSGNKNYDDLIVVSQRRRTYEDDDFRDSTEYYLSTGRSTKKRRLTVYDEGGASYSGPNLSSLRDVIKLDVVGKVSQEKLNKIEKKVKNKYWYKG